MLARKYWRPLANSLPLSRALAWILASVVMVSGSVYLGLQWKEGKRNKENQTPLTILVQTGLNRDVLPTSYLAELMGLSADHPICRGEFNLEEARKKLLACPVIREAKIHLLGSNMVYVDYALREPLAQLADCDNAGFDAEGRIFPLSPFFPPKHLRKVYFGLEKVESWDFLLEGEKLHHACELIALLNLPDVPASFSSSLIDVSKAEERSLGQREIVLKVDDLFTRKEGRLLVPRWIRLSPKSFAEELGDFLSLRQHLIKQEKFVPGQIIDLRIKKMAFISENKPIQIN